MPTTCAVDIDQRPATVAGIDGRVGLDVNVGLVRIDLPGRRADHAHGDRVLQSQRTAEGEDHLPLFQFVRSPRVASAGKPVMSIFSTARSVW